jgi:hypothetical protein
VQQRLIHGAGRGSCGGARGERRRPRQRAEIARKIDGATPSPCHIIATTLCEWTEVALRD